MTKKTHTQQKGAATRQQKEFITKRNEKDEAPQNPENVATRQYKEITTTTTKIVTKQNETKRQKTKQTKQSQKKTRHVATKNYNNDAINKTKSAATRDSIKQKV